MPTVIDPPTVNALGAALAYGEQGFKVLPVVTGDKKPLCDHGCKDASDSPEQIEQWWERRPDANVGVGTDGLVVVDSDGASNPWPGDFDWTGFLVSPTGTQSWKSSER